MKNAKKILALLLCAVLLVGATVAGTVAYLTDEEIVTNTFTVGNVDIKLEEYKIDGEGKKTTTVVTEQENIKLIPGREIEKEPFITVEEGSEDCWLIVKIENELAAAGEITMAAGWTEIGEDTGIYAYGEAKSAGDTITVFTKFTVNDELDDDLASYDGKTIKITAYAVQKEGFTSAQEAWNDTFGA